VFATAPAFRVCGDRADLCLQDHGLRGGGPTHRREPPAGGWAPVGTAGGAESVPEHEGFEAQRGGLESAPGLCTGAGESAHGFLFDLGDRDAGASPRAGQPRPWPGVSAIRFAPITGLCGHE
jgi:hypothetical protein